MATPEIVVVISDVCDTDCESFEGEVWWQLGRSSGFSRFRSVLLCFCEYQFWDPSCSLVKADSLSSPMVSLCLAVASRAVS